MENMNAILCKAYGPPDVLESAEVEKPIPKDKEVCIRIFATAVTASDCIVRSGNVSFWLWIPMRIAIGFTKPRQPILGIPFAGEIDSVGKEVNAFKKGDQVFGWDLFPAFGAYAEFKCISEKGMIALKPANINYEQAAAVPYGGLLALSVLKKVKNMQGKKILIYGASGAVGTSALQLAVCLGAEVTGVCSTTNMELVKSLGAHNIIDYTQENFTENGISYDIIFDAVGKHKFRWSKKEYSKTLTKGGTFLSIDNGTPKVSIEDLIFLKDQVETGSLKPVIDRMYPLKKIVEAHQYTDKGHKKGNVVIRVQ